MSITTYSPSVTGGKVLERARSFGMDTREVDGMDVEKVWTIAGEAIRKIREHNGPVFILAKCAHFEGHMLGDPLLRIVRHPLQRGKEMAGGFVRSILSMKGASADDRAKNLRLITSLLKRAAAGQKKKGNDPVYLTRQKLLADKTHLDELEKDVREEIGKAVETALLAADKEGGN
jgi:TPP-dependent pyruvate/acetoin dehydrogenase alpha subunit